MSVLSHNDVTHLFGAILENTNDLVIILQADDADPAESTIAYVNPAFTRLTGYSLAEAVGRSPRFLLGPNSNTDARSTIREAVRRHEAVRAEILSYTKSGQPCWLDANIVPLRDGSGRVSHFVAIERDITAAKTLEEKLTRMATRDELTGLYNRRHFKDVVEREIDRAERYGHSLALLSLDIDHFKRVNDDHGHESGDRALVEFSHACAAALRATDTLARVGGEEFAALLPETPIDGAVWLAERLRATIAEMTIEHRQRRFAVTVSIGVTAYAGSGDNLSGMLRRADQALYRAKAEGRNRLNVEAILQPVHESV
ncbi:MAG: diguanylate cyclase [Alphaproteobacteria bacterium]|nr:diguanylate cyclase [Alphaproteobacteria bacterium]